MDAYIFFPDPPLGLGGPFFIVNPRIQHDLVRPKKHLTRKNEDERSQATHHAGSLNTNYYFARVQDEVTTQLNLTQLIYKGV